MKIDDKLSEVFDIEPIQKTSNTKIIDAETGEIIQSASDKIEQDYDKARTNIHDLL